VTLKEPPPEALALIHHHPGRLRVRAEAFRAIEVGDRVRAALEVEPGISHVAHNARTGSLLIEYEPGLADVEAILDRAAAAAWIDPPGADAEALARLREPALVAIDAAGELNSVVYELTGYRADLRAVVPAGLAALAAYSLVKGKDPLPRWDNLLYWSYNIFSNLHRREIDAAHEAREGTSGAATPSKPGP
jgi:hypothetical protein